MTKFRIPPPIDWERISWKKEWCYCGPCGECSKICHKTTGTEKSCCPCCEMFKGDINLYFDQITEEKKEDKE